MRRLRRPPLDLHDAHEVVVAGRRAGLGQERLGVVVGARTREREEQDRADERRDQREDRIKGRQSGNVTQLRQGGNLL